MPKVKRGISLKPLPVKQCADPKGSITLEKIGPLHRVTLFLNDRSLEDKCKYGGYKRTYWLDFSDAELMYDEHLEWFKSMLGAKYHG